MRIHENDMLALRSRQQVQC